MTGATTDQAPGRLKALDGLRGLAAVVVVVHHSALISPALAAAYRGGPGARGWAAVLSYSPLHLPWAGAEAVVLFFVLSGLVLTLPFLGRRPDWTAYYPRRALRLYLPVWAAVAVAAVWWLLVPREADAGFSWWVNWHDRPLDLATVLDQLSLLGENRSLDSVLWSLKWEVWFSLLLPLYLYLAVGWRRGLAVKVVVLLVLVEVGVQTGTDALRYLPVFGLGVLLAVERDRLVRLAQGLTRRGNVVLLVVSLLLLDAAWLTRLGNRAAPAVAVGAVLLVALFLTWGPAIRVGERRPVQWLGRVSFSVYLLHEPVVISVAYLFGTTDVLLVLAVALPVSLLLAEVFYRAVELPAHRLSRRVGRRTAVLGA